MNDNVHKFPGAAALPENPMELAPRHPGWCSHEAVTLDEHTRTVTCANPKCGAVLDPFAFLASNAHTIQRAWIDELRRECEAAGVAFFFKQWGGASATAGGCEMDGAEFKGWPCAA